MTRRALLVLSAIAGATIVDLATLPMRMSALAVLGAWVASVLLAVVLACAIAAAWDRREYRAAYSEVLHEAKAALGRRA